MIKIWQSYACNNSGSYRVVARFTDAATAGATATELAEYFDAQAKLGNYSYNAGPLATLARTYGFDWSDGSAGSGPEVVSDGTAVIVFDRYCLGMGPGVPAFLADRGGVPGPERTQVHVQVSVMFRATRGTNAALEADLETMFAQRIVPPQTIKNWKAPWVTSFTSGEVAWFRDTETVGLYLPIDPVDLAGFRAWLAGHAIDHVLIELEPTGDRDRFRTVGAARCTACGGPLDYLDPRLHDIETPQLMCRPCGGLYDLSAFT